jgi:nucleoside-diphosphate-sugar epimerase
VPIGETVDVRDAAKAHVLAVSAPPVPGTDKRLLVYSGTFTWEAVVEVIHKARPELASRFPAESAKHPPQTTAPLDTSFAEEVIGLRKADYIPLEQTILATLDSVVEWEKKYRA